MSGLQGGVGVKRSIRSFESTEHEFLPQLWRDESFSPNRTERHPQVKLPGAVVTGAGNTVGTDPIDYRVERKRVQLVPQISKLAGISLMSVIEQQRCDAGSGNEGILMAGRQAGACMVKTHTFHFREKWSTIICNITSND